MLPTVKCWKKMFAFLKKIFKGKLIDYGMTDNENNELSLLVIVRLVSCMIQRKMATLWLSRDWELALHSFPQPSSPCKRHQEWVWSSQVLIALCKGLHQVTSSQDLKSLVHHWESYENIITAYALHLSKLYFAGPLTEISSAGHNKVSSLFTSWYGYFSADLKSFLSHLLNMHFAMTWSSVLFFLKKKVIFLC